MENPSLRSGIGEYKHEVAGTHWENEFLLKKLFYLLNKDCPEKRIFELGCGNGATAKQLCDLGYDVTGVDSSTSGIKVANGAYPNIKLRVGSAYDDLAGRYGQFPAVVSLEVIEHCYDPRAFAKTFYELLSDDGVGYISTPYHGYVKNLAIALMGKGDRHYSPLWDHGHIKFFSPNTLREILTEAGFRSIDILRLGRVPSIAKSMLAVLRK